MNQWRAAVTKITINAESSMDFWNFMSPVQQFSGNAIRSGICHGTAGVADQDFKGERP
jgi:hypothetical protein